LLQNTYIVVFKGDLIINEVYKHHNIPSINLILNCVAFLY